MKKAIIITIVLVVKLSASIGQKHIEGKVTLNPDSSYLTSELVYFFDDSPLTDSLVFFLHDGLKVEALSGSGIDSFKVVPAENIFGLKKIPFTNFLIIYLNDNDQVENFKFRIKYQGIINPGSIILGPDTFHKDWVELSLGSAWFPFDISLDNKFTHQLQVTLPFEFKLSGIGSVSKIKKKSWIISSGNPNLDMVLLAAKDLQEFNYSIDSINCKLLYTSESKVAFNYKKLAERGAEILDFYNSIFKSQRSFNTMKIAIPPDRLRSKPEGYSRTPFIMLSHTLHEDSLSLYNFLAHEIGHFWFSNSNTRSADNFLNESFAEYLAMIAMKQIFGDSVYNKIINEKQKILDDLDLPSIKSLNDSPDHNFDLLYVKGPIILKQLEELLGPTSFRSLLKSATEMRNLNEFKEYLRFKHGKEVENWFVERF